MTAYVSVRDALIRDINSAEAALTGANDVYDDAQRKSQQAQNTASRAYGGRVINQRNVDRLKKALAIIDGDTDD